jgi:hypothetical protein
MSKPNPYNALPADFDANCASAWASLISYAKPGDRYCAYCGEDLTSDTIGPNGDAQCLACFEQQALNDIAGGKTTDGYRNLEFFLSDISCL